MNPKPAMPKRPRVSLTCRCTRACSYCSQGAQPWNWRAADELSGEAWIARLRELCSEGYDSPILTGGEPTLHRDFVQIVNGLPWRSWVFTNLEVPFDIESIRHGKMRVTATLHDAGERHVCRWTDRVRQLLAHGFGVQTECLPDLRPEARSIVKHAGIALREKPFIDESCPPTTPVECGYHAVFIAPDGRRFFCNSKLNAKDESAVVEDKAPKTWRCDRPTCNGCDWWFITKLTDAETGERLK